MDIGDYYSRAFNGFKDNPILLIPTFIGYILIYGIVVVVGLISLITFLGADFFTSGQFNPDSINFTSMGIFFILYFIIMILAIIISSYMSAATIGMSKSIINWEKPELGVGVKNGNRYFLKIIAVSIIIGILLIIFILPAIAGVLIDQTYGLFPILTILGILLSLILLLVTVTIFIFTNQAIVAGDKSVIGSLKDSVKLIKENLVDVIVVLLINLVVLACIMAILMFINLFLSIIPIVGALFGLVLNVVVYSIVYPYFTLVLTYLYMDKKGIILPEILPAETDLD